MTWVAAGVASAGATLAVYEKYQSDQDRKKDEKNRPKYEVPDEIKQNLSDAQRMALEGLPEEQKQQFLSNLQNGTSYGLNQLSTRKAGLAGVAQLNQNENQGYQNLLAADSQARNQNQQILMGARQNMADYKDQSFQLNKINPYYENIARRDASNAALYQNLSGSMQAGTSGIGGSSTQQKPQNTNPNSYQYGTQNQYGNMYNYNPSSNKYGVAPDGTPNYGDYV